MLLDYKIKKDARDKMEEEDHRHLASQRRLVDSNIARKLSFASKDKRQITIDEEGNEVDPFNDDIEMEEGGGPLMPTPTAATVMKKASRPRSKQGHDPKPKGKLEPRGKPKRSVGRSKTKDTGASGSESSGTGDANTNSKKRKSSKTAKRDTGKGLDTGKGSESSKKRRTNGAPKSKPKSLEIVEREGVTDAGSLSTVEAVEVEVEAVEVQAEECIVESFLWPKKKFVLKWSDSDQPQLAVVKDSVNDYPKECMQVIWRDHRENKEVVEWIDKAGKRLKKLGGKDWKGLLHYAEKEDFVGWRKHKLERDLGKPLGKPPLQANSDKRRILCL